MADLVLSADGRHLATAGSDKRVRVWDAQARGERRAWNPDRPSHAVWTGGDEPVYAVAFSPDNRHVAAAGAFGGLVNANIPVWDVQQPDAPPLRLGTGVDSGLVDFAPSGRRLALSRRDGVEVWSIDDPRAPLTVVPGRQARFGGNDDTLATLHDKRTIRIWDLGLHTTGSPKTSLQSSADIETLAFARDGRYVVASDGRGVISRWDLLSVQTPPVTFTGPRDGVSALAMSVDGARLAAAGHDGSLRLWDGTAPGVAPVALTGSPSPLGSLTFSASADRLFAGSDDGNVYLWDLTLAWAPPVLSGHKGKVDGVSASADGRWLASSGEDTTVRVWPLWPTRCAHACGGT